MAARLHTVVVVLSPLRPLHASVAVPNQKLDLAKWAQEQRGRKKELSLEQRRLLEGLPHWTWRQAAASWEDMFRRLERSSWLNGFSDPTGMKGSDSTDLAAWTEIQHRAHRSGYLSAERAKRLEGLPGWSSNEPRTDWETGLAELEAYLRRCGTCEVPAFHKESGFRLGNWVIRQRLAKRGGSLSTVREAKLAAMPSWTWRTDEPVWREGLDNLALLLRDGPPLWHEAISSTGFPIGPWTGCMRLIHELGNLPAEWATQLEEVRGWSWHEFGGEWENAFGKLDAYLWQSGSPQPSLEEIVADFPVGRWTHVQKLTHEWGRLSEERIGKLEELPGWNWHVSQPVEAEWQIGFELVRRYVLDYGDSQIPLTLVVGGFELGKWVKLKRDARTMGTIDPEEARALHELAGWSWS